MKRYWWRLIALWGAGFFGATFHEPDMQWVGVIIASLMMTLGVIHGWEDSL